MKKVFYSVFMLLLAGSLLGQKPMAAHKITSYLEAFELDANDFLLQNLNEQVKPAPQQSQRSINSCVSIPGIPCDEGALDLLDFDFVPPGSINDCSVVADAGTDDNCFNPGDIPSGVTFSTTNDQGFEQGLVTLGEGSFGAPSGVFGPTAFSDDLVISFSVPTSYVEFDYLSLLGSGTVAVEVYDADASLICTETASFVAGAAPQQVVVNADSPISSIIFNGSGQSVGELIDNFGFSNSGCSADCDWMTTDIGIQNSDYDFNPCAAGPTDYNISTDGYNLIPNTSDNMAFASLPLCGNGGIQARIESVTGGYAGLMIRESSAPGAKMTAIYSNLTNLLRRETRYTTNGTRSSGLINAAFPTMLRLVRQGDYIRGFYKNSSQWVLFHQVYLPMDECVEMGLAVFSTDPFGTATATFDKVNFMSGMNLSAPNTGPIADALADVQRARIAPNPTSGAFTLDFERPLEIAATAVLHNELGQAIQQLQLPAGAVNHNFDGSTLPRGLYFLEVRDEQGYREVLKVVRQ